MKKTFLLTAVCLAMIGLSGCTTRELINGELISFSEIDFAKTRFKKGRACANYLFPTKLPFTDGWVGFHLGGEARVLDAISDARINKVLFMESVMENYIILGRECIDVYGQ